jgi:hypothetical protein
MTQILIYQILNSKQVGQHTSAIWEFFYEEKNDHEEIIAIVCSLYGKKWKSSGIKIKISKIYYKKR